MNSVLRPPPGLGGDSEQVTDWELSAPGVGRPDEESQVIRQKVGAGDPFEKAALKEDLRHALEQVLTYASFLSRDQRDRLREALSKFDPVEGVTMSAVEYGAGFDLAGEVEAQIAAVRAVRATVIGSDGRILPGISSREAKEVISSGSTLLTTLMRFHEKVQNLDRLRKLESSVLDALREVDPDLQEEVIKRLEDKLSDEEA